jgi:hypothetical protein
MEVSDQTHAPVAYPREKSPWYPTRVGVPQNGSGLSSIIWQSLIWKLLLKKYIITLNAALKMDIMH